jgi:hypothetical protein
MIADRPHAVGDQVVAGFPDPQKNLGMIAEEVGRPLIGLAAQEAVEVLEARPERPTWKDRVTRS